MNYENTVYFGMGGLCRWSVLPLASWQEVLKGSKEIFKSLEFTKLSFGIFGSIVTTLGIDPLGVDLGHSYMHSWEPAVKVVGGGGQMEASRECRLRRALIERA